MRTLAAVAGVTALAAACTPPGGQTVYYPPAQQTYEMSCEATSSGTSPSYSTITEGMTTVAPVSVGVTELFVISFQMDPLTTPAGGSGVQTTKVGHWSYRFPLPEHTQFDSVSLLEGSGYVGTPTVSFNGTYVQFDLLSWQPPDTDIVFPTVLVALRATGAVGSTITTTVNGTTYGNWGYKFKNEVNVAGTSVFTTSTCFPVQPPPVLSATTIR